MSVDRVELLVGGKRIERFESYAIEADLYTADDAFRLELANPEAQVEAGMTCELRVNGTLELTGLIDKKDMSYDKQGSRLVLEGRDLVGLLVDSYAEDFVTIENLTLSEVAQLLLDASAAHPAVPFISRKQISYQEDFVGRLKGKKKAVDDPLTGFVDTPQRISQIEPGMTKFEILRNLAMSRGLMFYALPDGTLTFGRPRAQGQPEFSLVCRRDGRGNNVLSGRRVVDLSQQYSQVTVIGQQQGSEDLLEAAAVNVSATVPNEGFPFYKPFVTTLNHDSQSPQLHGRLLLEKMQKEGHQISYTVPGHGQQGRNWRVNALCAVRDEVLDLDGVYLVYGRTFERSRQQGTTTRLTLGPVGVVA